MSETHPASAVETASDLAIVAATDRRPILLMTAFAIMITLFSVGLHLELVDDENWILWLYLGFLFGQCGNLVSWFRLRMGLHWGTLFAIPLVIVLSSSLMCAVSSDLFFVGLPLFSIYGFLCWLASAAFQVPAWDGNAEEVEQRRVFSLQALMALTLAQALLFLVLKYGDFEELPPWGFVLLISTAIASWLLGGAMVNLSGWKTALLVFVLLAALCVGVRILLEFVDIGQSPSDARHLSFQFLLGIFVSPAVIGLLSKLLQKFNLHDSLRRKSDGRSAPESLTVLPESEEQTH